MNDWLTYAVSAFLENFWYVVVAVFGAVVGSFLGVVVYRLPIIELTPPALLPQGYSLSSPPSYCPHCRHKLESWENVPVLGFLWLKGRCSDCKKPIPWRDFAMELLTACTWVAIFHRYNDGNPIAWVNVMLLSLFASVLIAAVFIDLDHFIVPESLNRVGMVIGLGRGLLVIGVAFMLLKLTLPDEWGTRFDAARVWRETLAAHTYFGWLPRGFVGAALYAGVLWLVSFFGYLAYAREEDEPLSATAKRFFTRQEDEPEAAVAVLPVGTPGTVENTDEPDDDSPPIRLRFSPGFVILLCGALLFSVVGAWSLLIVVLPLAAFIALTRTKTETVADAFKRFFRADDLPYDYDAPAQELSRPVAAPSVSRTDEPLITGANVGDVWNAPAQPAATPASNHDAAPPSFAETQADADQFAKEAESGTHGGMGLGDAKLAITIGAILGPGQAMLSLIFAAFLGAITGLILKAIYRKNTLRLAVPFVPFMAAGAFICLLFGEQIITWYTGFYMPTTSGATDPSVPHLLPNGQVELPSDRFVPRRP